MLVSVFVSYLRCFMRSMGSPTVRWHPNICFRAPIFFCWTKPCQTEKWWIAHYNLETPHCQYVITQFRHLELYNWHQAVNFNNDLSISNAHLKSENILYTFWIMNYTFQYTSFDLKQIMSAIFMMMIDEVCTQIKGLMCRGVYSEVLDEVFGIFIKNLLKMKSIIMRDEEDWRWFIIMMMNEEW